MSQSEAARRMRETDAAIAQPLTPLEAYERDAMRDFAFTLADTFLELFGDVIAQDDDLKVIAFEYEGYRARMRGQQPETTNSRQSVR